MTPHSPEKSAAERARELLGRLPRWPWTLEHRAVVDADDETILDDVGLRDSAEDLQEFIAASPALVEQLLQDLAAATERAEKAEKHRDEWLNVASEKSQQILRLESELTTCRAALDRTRQDADAQLGRLSGLQYSHDSAWKIIDELKRKLGVTGMRSGDAEDELCSRVGMACDAVEAVRDLQREREHSGWNSTPFWRKAKALSEMPLPLPPKET